MFKAESDSCSIDLAELATTKSTVPWFSPGPHNVSVPHADTLVCAQLDEMNKLDELEHLWMGELCDTTHHLVLKLHRQQPYTPRYFHALHFFRDSGVFCWEVMITVIPGTSHYTWEHLPHKAMPTIIPVTSLQACRIVAWSFEWKSWYWQKITMPEWAKKQRPGIRGFLCNPTQQWGLMEVACNMAFWALSRTTILKFAKHWGIHPPKDSSLFQVLFIVIQSVLKTSNEDTMRIIQKRLVAEQGGEQVNECLLDMDDCSDLLEKTDVEALKSAKKTLEAKEDRHAQFRKEYLAKYHELWPAAAAAAPPPGPPAAGAAAAAAAAPSHLCWRIGLTQQEAKLLLPPDTSIWQSRSRGGWMGHCPPYRRISAMFVHYPSQDAALRCLLQRLWTLHFDRPAAVPQTCPVKDLFE